MRRPVMAFDNTFQIGLPACVGRVVQISADGEILVDYPGNKSDPVRARLAVSDPIHKPNQAVLLVFENADQSLPIIAGVIRDKADNSRSIRSTRREQLLLEAKKELTLVCGQSSITLRSDGRVIVKGAELLSRASGTNKIRGATVKIN